VTGLARGPGHLAAQHLQGFIAALGAAGVAPGVQKQVDFLRGVALLRPSSPVEFYWTARTTLVSAREELDAFDRVYEEWFGDGLARPVPPPLYHKPHVAERTDRPFSVGAERDEMGRRKAAGGGASSEDVLGHGSFPATSMAQQRLLAEVEAALVEEVPTERGRRRKTAPRGSVLDLRRVMSSAGRRGGEILRLHWRDRPRQARRVLMLVDISGSLRQSSGDALRFAHALVQAVPRCDVYTFGTRLTRVTRELRTRDVDAALAKLAHVVPDVNGGTRIGPSLEEFLADRRRAAVPRDALVLVVSDGLERGDPEAMAAAVARLGRLSHRVVWWSPLVCDTSYRPITRGMAAVLGDLDDLVGVRDLASALDALGRLRQLDAGRRHAAAATWSATTTDDLRARPTRA